MIIFVFVFSLLGLQLFNDNIDPSKLVDYRNYYFNVENSFMNTF